MKIKKIKVEFEDNLSVNDVEAVAETVYIEHRITILPTGTDFREQ